MKKIFENELYRELLIFIVAIVFMSFILGITIKGSIIFFEPINFLIGFLYSIVLFGVFILAQKLTAYNLDCKTSIKLLSFRRYWFQEIKEGKQPVLPFDFPLWFVLPIIFSLFNIKWLAILDADIEPRETHVKRRWANITESDIGRIVVAGPLALFALAIFTKLFGAINFAFLASLFTFLTILPFGLGFKLYNSSPIFWAFTAIFFLANLFLMIWSNIYSTILSALLLFVLLVLMNYIFPED